MQNAKFEILIVVLLTVMFWNVMPRHLVSGYLLSKVKGLLNMNMNAL